MLLLSERKKNLICRWRREHRTRRIRTLELEEEKTARCIGRWRNTTRWFRDRTPLSSEKCLTRFCWRWRSCCCRCYDGRCWGRGGLERGRRCFRGRSSSRRAAAAEWDVEWRQSVGDILTRPIVANVLSWCVAVLKWFIGDKNKKTC